MAINAENNGVKRELIEAGNYLATCYQMIHLGTAEEIIEGKPKKMNKVRISWELPEELRVFDEAKGEQPLSISAEYTLSMHEKASLRKMLEAWRGKQFTEEEAKCFDITKLLGVACMLNVIHKTAKSGSVYHAISSITAIPKSITKPKQINQNFEFNFTDKFNANVLEAFPDFIRDRIKKSDEFKAINSVEMPSEFQDLSEKQDDLPF